MDDMREILTLVMRFAHMEGYSALAVDNVHDACSQIASDEIFASLRMAFLDIEVGQDLGFEVYNRIRAKSASFPVVIMSGSVYHKTLYPMLAYDNYVSFMPKPFDMRTVRHLMREPSAWGGDVSRLFQTDPNLGHHELAPAMGE
ncbi:MAG TPA: response regulator [Kiritimatiellia bacterium]|nr:response regulator [Kiritimatiellia bacterium]HMO98005.1 response regulator [Kiritimatiellia bacterium]HMP95356.1 response regulator [Kiritimatiellia bacterium]